MRFYKIELSTTDGRPLFPSSLQGEGVQGYAITSLLPNGTQTNPAALNVEWDIPVAPFHAPAGQAFVRIWGLGLKDIGAAFNLNNMNISIFGGMAAGLPLANPEQARLLVKGQIFQAFGNWIGTEQTIDLILFPGGGTTEKPINLAFNWTAGTTMASALQNTLSGAFPSATINIQISPRLVQDHDEPAVYGTLNQLDTLVNQRSKRIITDESYHGVGISYNGDTITVSDLSQPTAATPKKIAFQDLIGQPTWIAPGVIQAKLVMRGDLNLFDTINLPASLVTNTAGALSNLTGNPANQTTFSGDFTILEMHHFGNFRQPDAGSWNTTINMITKLPTQ